ncbi:MAG: hypothetical protein CO170_02970 [candidate division SR1 bacterium CG_4_9_14_3_um_filter_40_9]|nr:MAG: hypothetical protein CO170_02970 [candidate division SR1 bacterium CG_4_9_14_3_um_filter_40_9]
MIRTLAIETSCDDTSVGIVSFDGKIFQVEKLLAYSQIQNHQQYGGVVPEIASRLHSEKIIEILENIGRDTIKTVDFVSVTIHPGLPGALVVGKATANLLADFFNKPVVQVNHIYGHLFSLLLERSPDDIQFPLAVLTASGGHNDLYIVTSLNPSSEEGLQTSHPLGVPPPYQEGHHALGNFHITKIGQTLDDAAGECFDKVARMLGGPYPGGQRIAERALSSPKSIKSKVESPMTLWPSDLGPYDINFKRIFLSKEGFDFSFSGMKSQVSGLLKKFEQEKVVLDEKLICEIAYEFQEAVVEVLAKKLIRAGIKYNAKTLGIAGGVSCNERLREYLNEQLIKAHFVRDKSFAIKGGMVDEQLVVIRPVKKVYSTDNAAMIGLVGILQKLT